MSEDEVMRWAMSILRREQGKSLYGNVAFTFQNGTIKTVKIEQTEIPSGLTRK